MSSPWSFHFIYQGDDPVDPKFSIDNQGRIFTSAATNELDREEVAQYSLTVIATDLAGHKVGSTMKGGPAYPKWRGDVWWVWLVTLYVYSCLYLDML